MIRSFMIALALVGAAAGCGKKKSPATPANTAPDAAGAGSASESDMKEKSTPDDADDQKPLGADPCDGGE